MKIGILTSSRADFGIYLPLLKGLRNDSAFNFELIVFGTHLSPFHGYTIDYIKEMGHPITHTIESLLLGDSKEAISTAMALTQLKFSGFWERMANYYDLVFCLGDRYEMYAAVSAAVPFNIKFAHIHGGETTLGAIDNQFRHCISIFSSYHFVATETYAKRVAAITGSEKNIYNIGALALDNLSKVQLYSPEEFFKKFKIDVKQDTILVTYHPETISPEKNRDNAIELANALAVLPYQIVITLPNADTSGATIRNILLELSADHSHIKCIENFGIHGFFSCMKYCRLILGNSSSAIIEAASFNKYVINLGKRQKGRITSDNVFSFENFNSEMIVKACEKIIELGEYGGQNVYYNGGAVNKIINILNQLILEKS